MKNRILIRIVILFITLVVSNTIYSCSEKSNTAPVYAEIPDKNFKACLKKIVPLAFTADGKFISNHPSVVSYEEIMSISNKKISSLSGIEYFISLKVLDCLDNQLTTIDISNNLALTNLYCGHNQLTNIDVSKNINLIKLDCSSNKLITLDVSKNPILIGLICYNNLITSIKFGDNEVLRKIYCPGNRLAFLDVRRNKGLIELNCKDNLRNTVIIVDPNSKLARLYLDSFIMCNHPSIKAFKDQGGELYGTFSEVLPPFKCK